MFVLWCERRAVVSVSCLFMSSRLLTKLVSLLNLRVRRRNWEVGVNPSGPPVVKRLVYSVIEG